MAGLIIGRTNTTLSNTVQDEITRLGTVTAGTIDTSVILTGFVGMVAPFAMTSPPTGWLACDGSAVSRTVTYSALFAAISTTWGVGDGSSTFNVPDLEGAFLRGTGSHASSNMSNGNDFAGPSLGAFENDQFMSHDHPVAFHNSGSGGTALAFVRSNGTTGYATDFAGTIAASYISSQGTPRFGDETRPFNAGVKYCIKY